MELIKNYDYSVSYLQAYWLVLQVAIKYLIHASTASYKLLEFSCDVVYAEFQIHHHIHLSQCDEQFRGKNCSSRYTVFSS